MKIAQRFIAGTSPVITPVRVTDDWNSSRTTRCEFLYRSAVRFTD